MNKLLVIGLGSMGKRRIRLIKQHFPEISVFGVDTSDIRRKEASESFDIQTFSNLEDALAIPLEGVFICTAPLSHNKIISRCLLAGLHVFTELNLVSDGYHENMRLAEEVERVLFLSSTFLYRNDTNYLIGELQKADCPLFYTYHVGQYLPDWHPWESFQDFFVSEKRTGGCREILAIELPWLMRAFGNIASLSSRCKSMSSLQLPYPDTYWIHLDHEGGAVGQLTIDLVSRVPVRHFEAFGENLQLEWRGKPEDLRRAKPDYSAMQKVDIKTELKRQEHYRDFIVEDAYLSEIQAFFDAVQKNISPIYTFSDDLRTLSVIEEILGGDY